MTVIHFLGGCREVGRSAILVDSIMLDYGMKPSSPPEFPLNGVSPSNAIITHAHLDHVGVAPNLVDCSSSIYMTPPSRELSHILLKDSLNIMDYPPYTKREFRQFEDSIVEVEFCEPFELSGWDVTFYNAGHIPGSAMVHMSRDINILYTGDIKLEDTRLMNKAEIKFPETDILIIESTYFGVVHPEREELEREFVESVIETLDAGGHAIIPAFAVGRTQEILMILEKHGITPYVDGMGKDVGKILEQYPEYVKDAKDLKKAIRNAIPVERGKRERVLEEPAVVVTTAGMLNGGPAMFYISRLYKDEKSKVLLTGYQVEGTNGDIALKTGMLNLGVRTVKLRMGIEQYDFSAHADDEQLKEFVKKAAERGVEIVFTVHGEDSEKFAEWIEREIEIEAYAPKNGEVYVI